MEVLRKTLEQIMREINNVEPELYDKIKNRAMKRFEGHKVRFIMSYEHGLGCENHQTLICAVGGCRCEIR